MIVAVDGPAAAGKGTLARAIAEHFGLRFLDTGSLYRMTARAVLNAGGDPEQRKVAIAAAIALDPNRYRDEDLRSEEVGDAASIVALIPEVRAALLGLQREFARKPPGAVLDGRDIGTVVCPDAEVKIFVTATAEVRARRRAAELGQRGTVVDFQHVLDEIRARDERDRTRPTAPLVPAADAVVLDTSGMEIDEAISAAIAIVAPRLAAKKSKRV